MTLVITSPLTIEQCIQAFLACACRQSGAEFVCEGMTPRHARVPIADVLRERLKGE